MAKSGTNTKGRCVFTFFTKVILCAGSMTDYFFIKRRELSQAGLSDLQAVEDFETIDEIFGYLEAIKPTARFDGVNIDSNVTHFGYIPFDDNIYELDINSLFVEKEGGRKNRLFKLLKIMNLDELDKYLVLHLKETGFVDKQATEG